MKAAERVAIVVTTTLLIAPVWAQSPPPQRRARPATTPSVIIVRDVSGTPLADVRIAISGAARSEASTNAEGTATVVLADGLYRLRFERDGFITLEREVTVRNVRPAEIAVALNRAPPPPAPPPAPAPVAQPAPVPVATAGTTGPPVNVSIPSFLDKNFVGRDPLKESILSCMPGATARLLQLREAMGVHTHADLDEVLYVVAGDGAVRIADEWIAITPGSMIAIPRGTRHAIERRGRNPLIVLSTLAGAPCPLSTTRAGTK